MTSDPSLAIAAAPPPRPLHHTTPGWLSLASLSNSVSFGHYGKSTPRNSALRAKVDVYIQTCVFSSKDSRASLTETFFHINLRIEFNFER